MTLLNIIKKGYQIMIKNIMGTVLAIAVAFGAGTNMSHATTQNNTEKIVKASGSTTLSDHHAKVRFTRSSDIKTISKSYQLKNSDKISEIIYLPVNDYSINDAAGQKAVVSVETRLASYSVSKKGFYDQASFVDSAKSKDHSFTLNKSVLTNYDFSNIKSISGSDAALESCLKKAYDFSVSKKSILKESLKISSKDDASIQVYTLNRIYDYQLWEADLSKDVSSDSYLGNGTIKRPIGVIITVNANK